MKQNNLTQWIDLNDEKQVRWAFMYLARKESPHHPILSTYLEIDFNSMRNEISRFKSELFNDLDNKTFVSKMREAWRQERYRQARKSKSKEQYSFVLSKETSKELTQLAKKIKRPRNHTLELLISRSFSHIEAQHNQIKEDKAIEEREVLKKRCDQLTHELEQLRSVMDKQD